MKEDDFNNMQMNAIWWCEKCVMDLFEKKQIKMAKEMTPKERKDMKPKIFFVCGTCEDCSE